MHLQRQHQNSVEPRTGNSRGIIHAFSLTFSTLATGATLRHTLVNMALALLTRQALRAGSLCNRVAASRCVARRDTTCQQDDKYSPFETVIVSIGDGGAATHCAPVQAGQAARRRPPTCHPAFPGKRRRCYMIHHHVCGTRETAGRGTHNHRNRPRALRGHKGPGQPVHPAVPCGSRGHAYVGLGFRWGSGKCHPHMPSQAGCRGLEAQYLGEQVTSTDAFVPPV